MSLWIVFVIGLAGSVHCIGMCGGFVVALSQLDRTFHPLLRHTAYYIGKTATYAAFGAVAGAAGLLVADLLGRFQNALSIALGVTLVLLGLWLLGMLRMRRERSIPGLARLSKALGLLVRNGSVPALFGLGMLNGLLPCAMVYAMLVTAAASGSMVGGALTMTVFGLATIPALVAVSLSARLAQPIWRGHVNRVAGVLVILLGVLTVLRGLPNVERALHGPHPVESSESTESVPHMHH